VAVAAAIALAAGVLAQAGEGGEGGKRERHGKRGAGNEAVRNQWQEFNEQIREKVKAHFEAQREARPSKEELKGKTPAEALALIKENMLKHYAENTAFFDAIHQERMDFARQLMAGSEMPAEQQAARLAKIEEMYAARKAFREEMFQKRIDALTQLASDPDLTWEKLRETRKACMEQCKAGREGMRERFKERAGKRLGADKTE